MPRYNYQEALELKKQGYTNEEAARHFGYAGEAGFRRRHNREISKRAKKQPSKKEISKSEYRAPSGIKYAYSHMTDREIRRTRYGDLPPTGYISPLDHQAWLVEFGGKDVYRWDLPHLRHLQAMYWSGNREVGLIPRGGGKTLTWSGLTARWCAEVYEPVLTVCSPKRTKTLHRSVEKFVLRNPRFRRAYGDIIAVDGGNVQSNRTEGTLLLNDEFDYPFIDELLKVASIESDIIGRHPRKIVLEDIIQQESPTEEGQQKVKDWYTEVLDPMLSLETGQESNIISYGTRKGPSDWYSWLFSKGWNPVHYKAVNILEGELPSHSDIIWQETENAYGEFNKNAVGVKKTGSFEFLNPYINNEQLLIKAALQYEAFMSQYQNEPVAATGAYFERAWWESALVPSFNTSGLQKYVFVDTAFGQTSKSDYNAIITVCIREKHIYIIDCYLGQKLKFDELIKQITRMSLHHEAASTTIHQFQREVWVVQEARRYIPSVNPYPETKNKVMRIETLDVPFKMGEIRIFDDLPYMNVAKTQYLQFDRKPSNATKKDDFLDVLATAYEKLKYHMHSSTIKLYSR